MGENSEPIKAFLDRIGPDVEAGMLLSEADQKRIYNLAVLADEQDTSELSRLRSELEASRARVAELEALVADLTLKARNAISTLREACKLKNDKIEEQDARIAELEAAIKPFAEIASKVADMIDGWSNDDFAPIGLQYPSPTLGDLRRARDILERNQDD